MAQHLKWIDEIPTLNAQIELLDDILIAKFPSIKEIILEIRNEGRKIPEK